MRKQRFMIGVGIAVLGSFVVASTAMAANTQTLTVKSNLTKQFKKTKGASDLDVDIATQIPLGTPVAQTPQHTDVDFDKDLSFTPGNIATCGGSNPKSALAGTNTAAALAACPGAQVGSGTAKACSPVAGCALTPFGGVNLTVTAFNGINNSLVLHARGDQTATTLVLVGQLIRSPLGGQYGQRLSVDVDDTSSTNLHLVDFHTIVPKKQSVKKNKKKGKPAKFYISARCSGDRRWQFSETTQYRAGGGSSTATTEVPCQQKKEKKKKK
jgi:hypothetical protein